MTNYKEFRDFIKTKWYGAGLFQIKTGSPTRTVSGDNPAWLLDDAGGEAVSISFVHFGPTLATPVITLYYSMVSATTGTVTIQYQATAMAKDDAPGTGAASDSTTDTVPAAAPTLDIITLDVSSFPTINKGDFVGFTITRTAPGTATGDMVFYGVTISDA